MRNATRIIWIVALGFLLRAAPPPEAPAAPAPLVVRDASAAQQQQVGWAVQRFESAGLELPPVELAFHDGTGPCDGHPGLYQSHRGVAEIDICVSSNHVLLHELAHAWEGASVTDDVRQRFAARWGLDNWNDHSVPWKERGIERAADTIAFVLEGLPDQPSAGLLRFVCGYPLLTGQRLPDGAGIHCDS